MEIKNCEVCKHEFEKGYFSTPQVCMDCIDTIYSELCPNSNEESDIVYAEYLAKKRLNIVEKFLENKIGKVLVLHASSGSERNKTNAITTGVIEGYAIHDGTGEFREGFIIQLANRFGETYKGIERFFGNFDFEKFEVNEMNFSDTLRIVYKDGSYFVIEVRI